MEVIDKKEVLEQTPLQALIERLNTREETLSFSSFNAFCKSPRHFMEYKFKVREETRAMLEGTVIHAAVLEPESFDETFAVEPVNKPSSANQKGMAEMMASGMDYLDAYTSNYTVNKLTKAQLEKAESIAGSLSEYVEWLKSVGDRKIIPADIAEMALKASDHLWRNDASKYVLEQIGETEKGVTWEFSGYKWRGFIDGIGDNIRMDLKLVPDAKPRKARWTIEDARYHWQVGNFYGLPDGCGGDREAYIVCIDRSFHISVHQIRKAVIHENWDEIKYRMSAFKRCLFLNEWEKSYDFWTPNGIYEI